MGWSLGGPGPCPLPGLLAPMVLGRGSSLLPCSWELPRALLRGLGNLCSAVWENPQETRPLAEGLGLRVRPSTMWQRPPLGPLLPQAPGIRTPPHFPLLPFQPPTPNPSNTSELWGSQHTSVQFSRSVMSNFLRPHRLQHAKLPCPSPTPGACSNSGPSSR